MNLTILNAGQPLTMSSREVAELCEKEHRNVKRDTENMLMDLKIDALRFEHIYLDSMNRKQTEYRLDKELSMTLVAGYNVVLRNRIIKRWMELEERAAAPALPDFSNPAAAARAWAEQFEQRQIVEEQKVMLEHKVAEQAPKVAAQDLLAISKGDLCVRDAAKVLNVSEKRFSQMLIRLAWAYRRQSNGRLVGYTAKEQQGLITHRPVTVYHKSGEVEAVAQLLLTPKGVAKLAELIATGEVA